MKIDASSRTISRAAVAAIMLVFTGCDEMTEPEPIATCAALNGAYVATSMSVESISNPDVLDDLDDAVWQIDFSGATFTSQFARPGEAATVQGTPSTSSGNARQITLGTEPLLPDVEPGDQSFICNLEDNGFDLQTTELAYDFDGDGTYESALFSANFAAK